jgi:SAM-dependent methyltransferase
MRTIIYMLALELFGEARMLPEFTNTFYDREPYLDITAPHSDRHGTYDFILSSDVFEHVAPPIERAFEEAFRLLKPYGVLCTTVPSVIAEQTDEHYPDLYQYSVVELAGEHVLINRKKDRMLEIHDNLVFHGGIGATLEMRLFAQADLVRKLRGVGFSDVVLQMEPVERFGIVFDGPWSRPLVARKQPYPKISASALPAKSEIVSQAEPPAQPAPAADARLTQVSREKAALEERLAKVETQLRLAAGSRWLRLGRSLGLGPNLEQHK